MQQFLASGTDCIVECGPPSQRQPLHTLGQQIRIADEILRHRRMIFESHDEAEVTIPVHRLVKECARCVPVQTGSAKSPNCWYR